MDKPYSELTFNRSRIEFTFTIKGRNENEQKKIKFSKIEHFDAYNLALGTIVEKDTIDYIKVTNNGDLVLLFSSIIQCINLFFKYHPGENVFFSGNTEQKTKVYQEILRRHYQQFSEKFNILVL